MLNTEKRKKAKAKKKKKRINRQWMIVILEYRQIDLIGLIIDKVVHHLNNHQ